MEEEKEKETLNEEWRRVKGRHRKDWTVRWLLKGKGRNRNERK